MKGATGRRRSGVTRRQPRIEGGRQHGGYGLPPRLYAKLQQEANRYGVTLPFVITNAVSFALSYELNKDEHL